MRVAPPDPSGASVEVAVVSAAQEGFVASARCGDFVLVGRLDLRNCDSFTC